MPKGPPRESSGSMGPLSGNSWKLALGSKADPYSGLDEYSGPGGDIFPTPQTAKTHVLLKVTTFFQNTKLFVLTRPLICILNINWEVVFYENVFFMKTCFFHFSPKGEKWKKLKMHDFDMIVKSMDFELEQRL